MPPGRGLRWGENFWLRLTTASTQCLRLLWGLLSFSFGELWDQIKQVQTTTVSYITDASYMSDSCSTSVVSDQSLCRDDCWKNLSFLMWCPTFCHFVMYALCTLLMSSYQMYLFIYLICQMAANSKIHNTKHSKRKKRYTKYTAQITVKEKDTNCTYKNKIICSI